MEQENGKKQQLEGYNNNYQMTIKDYEQALEIAKERKDQAQETTAYLNLGEAYRFYNQFETAIKYYDQALEIAKERKDQDQETTAYLNLGEAYRFYNQFETAIKYYEQALEIAKERKDRNQETTAYLGLKNQFQTAIKHYEQALEIAKERKDQDHETQACLNLGLLYRLKNQLQTAIKYYEQALEIAKERKDQDHETQACLNLGVAYRLNNQFQTAIKYYEQALEIAKELENKQKGIVARNAIEELSRIADLDAVNDDYNTNCDQNSNSLGDAQLQHKSVDSVNQTDIENGSISDHKIASAEQLLILGRSYQTQGRNEKAVKSYDQAVLIADETNHNYIKARAYQLLGNVFTGTSEYIKAIEYYQAARQIYPGYEADEMEVIAYQWLGYNHLQAGQYQESIEYYNEVARLASQLECKTREINASIGLGSAFSYIGDLESSEKYFLKAITVAKQLNHKGLKKVAHTNLGHVQYKSCKFNAAVKSYLKAEEISLDLADRKEDANACHMLGHTFQQLKKHEKAIKSYKKALSINKEIKNKEMQGVCFEKALEGIINEWCGYCCLFIAGQHQEAITFYENAKEIAKQVGEKYQEYRTNQAIGNIFCNIGNYEKAKEYYQEAWTVAVELGDRHCEGTSCLNLATVCGKDCDYKMAIEWYEKALYIVRTHVNDDILKEEALTGLGIAWFNLGDTKKAIDEIQKAQKLAKDSDTGERNVHLTHQHKRSRKKMLSSQTPDAIEDKESENVVMCEEKEPVITGGRERAEALMEEACNPSRTERLHMKDLVLIKKYIEISASYVYSRQLSTKGPFTEKVRKAMTEDVKKSAYTNLLTKNDDKRSKNDGEFVNWDGQVFNFAKSEVFKNSSTQMPARLNEHLVSYMKSIGQIACGRVRGTCFLVTDMQVITNYHVYRMIKDERMEVGNPNLPITVRFDYLYPEQTEHIVTVEVDEGHHTTLENPSLDYKFLRLKQSEGLTDRVPLGPMVRNWQLSDGRVVILGHPECKEMQEEVCVVVGYDAWLDRLNERYKQCSGVHMTNSHLLWNDTKYQDHLPYETTFFRGSSGSPVIEMNGNIIAMHTQGYVLDRPNENSPNQQENVSHQEHQDISRQRNTTAYSLMEFGVQFISICRDIRRWHGEDVVKLIFPNYELKLSEQPVDAT
ncbi:Tetratricopeptide repeat 28 [Paramuricea clavata]|uniref:Tetratricopeptide repeat 28 n=1 Tax=Paramuricea clavata TaxID=317549 RepID=A0A7D9DFW3_PARCT|nr:Tetratricopeptide repeat 28 [Paramuricea clavata]